MNQKENTNRPLNDDNLCTMCEKVESTYFCYSCGKLSFCTACCLSLHNNKFLCGHAFKDLRTDITVNYDEIQSTQYSVPLEHNLSDTHTSIIDLPQDLPLVAPIKKDQIKGSSTINQSINSCKSPSNLSNSTQFKEDNTDKHHVSHAIPLGLYEIMTRNLEIIDKQVQLVDTAFSFLNNSYLELELQETYTRNSVHTATEAIKSKFNLIREELDTKEKLYFEYINHIVQKRLEITSKTQVEVKEIISDIHDFSKSVAQQALEYQKRPEALSINTDTISKIAQNKIKLAEENGQLIKNRIEELMSYTMGVTIQTDPVHEAIKHIQVPNQDIIQSKDNVLKSTQYSSIPTTTFFDTPGTQPFIQQLPIDSESTMDNLVKETGHIRNGRYDKFIPELRPSVKSMTLKESDEVSNPSLVNSKLPIKQYAISPYHKSQRTLRYMSPVLFQVSKKSQGIDNESCKSTVSSTLKRYPSVKNTNVFQSELHSLEKQLRISNTLHRNSPSFLMSRATSKSNCKNAASPHAVGKDRPQFEVKPKKDSTSPSYTNLNTRHPTLRSTYSHKDNSKLKELPNRTSLRKRDASIKSKAPMRDTTLRVSNEKLYKYTKTIPKVF